MRNSLVVVVLVVAVAVVAVVVVVRTGCMTNVFVDKRQRMHLIGVAEHLGVRLPASPPPRALDNEELFVVEG